MLLSFSAPKKTPWVPQSQQCSSLETLGHSRQVSTQNSIFFFSTKIVKIFEILNTELDFRSPKDDAFQFLDQSELWLESKSCFGSEYAQNSTFESYWLVDGSALLLRGSYVVLAMILTFKNPRKMIFANRTLFSALIEVPNFTLPLKLNIFESVFALDLTTGLRKRIHVFY